MSPRTVLASLLAAHAWAVPAAAAPLSRMLHEPPAAATSGSQVPIAVILPGTDPEVASVVLHYRAQGAVQFHSSRLAARDGGRFAGHIPAAATRGLSIRYYIEAATTDGARQIALGSAAAPLSIRLSEPPAPAPSHGNLLIAAVAAATLAAGVLFHVLRRRRQRLLRERMFWVRTLFPCFHMEEPRLAMYLDRLAERELDHPLDGPVRSSHELLRRKLKEVGKMDIEALYARTRKLMPD